MQLIIITIAKINLCSIPSENGSATIPQISAAFPVNLYNTPQQNTIPSRICITEPVKDFIYVSDLHARNTASNNAYILVTTCLLSAFFSFLKKSFLRRPISLLYCSASLFSIRSLSADTFSLIKTSLFRIRPSA